MNKSYFLAGLLATVLLGLTACGQEAKNEPNQPGLYILLEADLPSGQTPSEESLEMAQQIIEKRLEGLEITGASVKTQGERRLSVELPEPDDPDAVVHTVQQTGLLEFIDAGDLFLPLDSEVQTTYRSGVQKAEETDPMTSSVQITDTEMPVFETIFTGDDLKRVDLTQNSQTGDFQVVFEMQDEAAERFAQYTQAHIGQVLAIVLDGVVISSPVIQSAIPHGRGVISGDFSFDEARSLTLQIRYGALPAPLKVIEVRTVP